MRTATLFIHGKESREQSEQREIQDEGDQRGEEREEKEEIGRRAGLIIRLQDS